MVIIIYLIIGSALGIIIIPEIANDLGLQNSSFLKNRYVDGIIGSIFMFLIFGVFIRRVTNAIKGLEHFIMRRSAVEILFATIGLIIGLLISVMVSFILESIGNSIFNHFIPVIITILLCYFGFQFGLKKRDEMLMFLPENIARSMSQHTKSATPKIIDTSAIIDGRILEVIRCGFIDGNILIPQGVINELQIVADSNDSVKREKGKRGLDILNELYDLDYPTKVIHPTKSHSDIDTMLLKLAKQYHANIITTDFNLNKVCHVHGIKALNVNDLSEAIKPNVHQGDQLHILLTKMGKEPGQAVGYLDDGTMVVVDNAKNLIGSHVNLEVVSLLQTSSGRIVFAKKIEDTVSL
ncbi:PIN/TRAM domain-containing protein [Staphylococcus aureus]|nr:PIN/TRAM domain-containing protein [Staphylococcus aureus]MBI0976144.1 PIN/TRAM domain-containing protein [Staphylococcus aureus]MBU9754263.1 PIN/TRAM domain-containing protein [Staphylococcus aureus]MBU9759542.1 PIN/TRAM domain-containing protein [Staphylococcus aureus]MBU9780070.1 PIN/TRAM domain-containing protein [Staphylococcus aureus]MBU9785128.1 PIN/TRAM domain-containing protein [Staphylococcus aureus]